jgi:hypothetical protein
VKKMMVAREPNLVNVATIDFCYEIAFFHFVFAFSTLGP